MRMIEERIAMWTKLPAENGEHFYLLHYGTGDEYKPHFDAFDPDTPEATNFTGLVNHLSISLFSSSKLKDHFLTIHDTGNRLGGCWSQDRHSFASSQSTNSRR